MEQYKNVSLFCNIKTNSFALLSVNSKDQLSAIACAVK